MKDNYKFKWELLSYSNQIERTKWRNICRKFDIIDIWYYPEYLRLFELHGDGEPFLFVYYETNEKMVIYPFMKRPINRIPGFQEVNPDLFDISSPYGYGGYLRNNDLVNMENFSHCFREFCRENNIISEFIRFNPILQNVEYAPKNVDIKQYNQTIVIDLSLTENDIWLKMNQTCRNKVRKAMKNNLYIYFDGNFDYIKIFYNLYIDTMRRLDAYEYYFFKENWFDNLINLLKGKIFLFHAYHNDVIVTSALFIVKAPFIHYFLTGATYEMRHLAATNLLLYEVALWAKKKGLKFFHLGGGYSPDDSLFRFKASFSPWRKDFYIGGVVHHPEYYDYLCNLRFKGKEIQQEMNFFPIYRIPHRNIECNSSLNNMFDCSYLSVTQ